jgi:glutamine synthetase
MRHFVAGQQALMPELLGMVAPTVNSYSRLIPGYWAPTNATWGVENRTCALRVIPGSAKSQRVEYRVAAADGNPYLGLAAALGSGLWGDRAPARARRRRWSATPTTRCRPIRRPPSRPRCGRRRSA